MKQIGLAMHNYHSAVSCFPPGGTNASNFSTGNNVGAGWGAWSAHAMMLPYMEQSPIANSLNFNIVSESNNNNEDLIQLTGIQRAISTFLCPSTEVVSYPQWSGGPTRRHLPASGKLLFRLRRVRLESVWPQPVGRASGRLVGSQRDVPGPWAPYRHQFGHRRDLEYDRHGRVDYGLQQRSLDQYLHLAAGRCYPRSVLIIFHRVPPPARRNS